MIQLISSGNVKTITFVSSLSMLIFSIILCLLIFLLVFCVNAGIINNSYLIVIYVIVTGSVTPSTVRDQFR